MVTRRWTEGDTTAYHECMTNDTSPSGDVADQIVLAFLKALEEQKLPAKVVAGLRKSLIEDRSYSDAALRPSILAEDDSI